MTGYARAQGRDARVEWTWEAKSVNGRGLEVRLRLPPGHDGMEASVRETAARHLKRGNVQLSLSVIRPADLSGVRINTRLLEDLLGLCREWGARHPDVTAPRWDGLLAVKGVIEPAEIEADDDEAERGARETAMIATLNEALAALAAMRRAEGGRLAEVLTGQIDAIAELAGRAAATAALRPDAVAARLKAQLGALLGAIPSPPEERIAQELALLAVKGDVREELDRLAAHVGAARELIAGGGAVGRKLDFLSQEFNREANTLCSKSSDVELTRIGLDLKAVIDQFREQIQNIE